MDNQEIKELLKQVLANQVVIFNQLRMAQGATKSPVPSFLVNDLAKEADKYIGFLKQ